MHTVMYLTSSIIDILSTSLSAIGNSDCILIAPFILLFIIGCITLFKGLVTSL